MDKQQTITEIKNGNVDEGSAELTDDNNSMNSKPDWCRIAIGAILMIGSFFAFVLGVIGLEVIAWVTNTKLRCSAICLSGALLFFSLCHLLPYFC